MKKLFIVTTVVSVLCFAAAAFAASEFYRITKIAANEVTVVDETGTQKTIAGNAKGVKVGDTVTLKGGKIIKGQATEVSPRLNPQPEPPGPPDIKKSAAGQGKAISTPERPTPPPKQGTNIAK